MQSKKIIITGVNGQLGQHLVKYVQENQPDLEIIGTLRHTSKSRGEEYIFDESGVKLELMDLSDSCSIEDLIIKHQPDYFVNTAANAFVGESWSVPVQHMEINAIAVLHMLEAIRKWSPYTRFCNLGTSEEFGDVIYSPQDERHPQRPRSPYGVAKCAARHLVKVWRESYGLYCVQPWVFNFESKLRDEKYVTRKTTKKIAEIRYALAHDLIFTPLQVGNIYSIRSWQHALDVADGIWRMLNQDVFSPLLAKDLLSRPLSRENTRTYLSKNITEYVISNLDYATVKQFIERSFKMAGIEGVWQGEGLDEKFVSQEGQTLCEIDQQFYRPAEVSRLQGNSERIRNELGWNNHFSITNIIQEMTEHDWKEINQKQHLTP